MRCALPRLAAVQAGAVAGPWQDERICFQLHCCTAVIPLPRVLSCVARLAAVQAELQLVRDQMGDQGAKLGELQRAAEGVRQRRELLQVGAGVG